MIAGQEFLKNARKWLTKTYANVLLSVVNASVNDNVWAERKGVGGGGSGRVWMAEVE